MPVYCYSTILMWESEQKQKLCAHGLIMYHFIKRVVHVRWWLHCNVTWCLILFQWYFCVQITLVSLNLSHRADARNDHTKLSCLNSLKRRFRILWFNLLVFFYSICKHSKKNNCVAKKNQTLKIKRCTEYVFDQFFFQLNQLNYTYPNPLHFISSWRISRINRLFSCKSI